MGLEKLRIIGNGDAFGSGGRFHTCFYLESTETNFLVDLGATAIHNLQANVNLNDIDLIMISHLHGDHFGGIPYFILNSSFLLNREEPLTILGPEGTKERVLALTNELYKGMLPKMERFILNFHEYESGKPIKFRDLEILALPAVHSDEANSHSLQIVSGNKKFAYSGDTEWTDNLDKIAKDSDFFLCECTYFDTEMSGHLNYLQLRYKLQRNFSKNALLTHLSEEMLDPANSKEVQFEYAEQDKEYKF